MTSTVRAAKLSSRLPTPAGHPAFITALSSQWVAACFSKPIITLDAENSLRYVCKKDNFGMSQENSMTLTVSRPELLINGNDQLFRRALHDALGFGSRLQEIRNCLGEV